MEACHLLRLCRAYFGRCSFGSSHQSPPFRIRTCLFAFLESLKIAFRSAILSTYAGVILPHKIALCERNFAFFESCPDLRSLLIPWGLSPSRVCLSRSDHLSFLEFSCMSLWFYALKRIFLKIRSFGLRFVPLQPLVGTRESQSLVCFSYLL